MTKKKTEKSKDKKQSADLQKLNKQLAELKKEKDETFEKLQRVSADYANYQKRAPKQIADTVTYEKERIIKTFLPVLDNFEHTLQNADSAESADVLIKGINIVYDQMLDILKSLGVEQIAALDENFDPALHQAMMRQSDPEKAEDIVLEEFQKGYKLNGRVIRPSRVIVNKQPDEETTQQQSDDEKEQQEEKQ